MKYGLIGKTLAHSYSKAIHGFLGNREYELMELPPDSVDGFLRKAGFKGINVTIPYKETVMPHCVLDDAAKKIVIVSRGGKDNYENIGRHADADALVNTTPVGMFPNNGQSPVSLDLFANLSAVLDVVYNPLRTRLVQ